MSLPYDHYSAVLYAINVLSQGNTLTEACRQANIPVRTFNSYVDNDPELAAMYKEADILSSDAMADALINIDNHVVHGHSDPKMAKVISDNIKWVLSKRRPKEYGDRVQVDHSVTVDVAITTALDAARRRLPQIEKQEVVDAEVVEDDETIMQRLMS